MVTSKGVLNIRPHVTRSENSFYVHICPGVPSAAIEDYANSHNWGLAHLVPFNIQEMLKSGSVNWVLGARDS